MMDALYTNQTSGNPKQGYTPVYQAMVTSGSDRPASLGTHQSQSQSHRPTRDHRVPLRGEQCPRTWEPEYLIIAAINNQYILCGA
jgi:hypothetical protein